MLKNMGIPFYLRLNQQNKNEDSEESFFYIKNKNGFYCSNKNVYAKNRVKKLQKSLVF